jgi:hypothetical protein
MSLISTLRRMVAQVVLALIAVLMVASCSDSASPDATLSAPATYDSTGFSGNVAEQQALLTEHQSLVTLIKNGRTPGTLIDGPAVYAIWEGGSEPLSASVALEFRTRALMAMGKAIMSAGNAFDPSKAPDSTGGTLGPMGGAYLFDNTGLESEQMVDKGLYLALHYYQASELLSQAPLRAAVDGVVALYGATPSFTNTYDASNPQRDRFSAGYICRRDKNDGTGMYTSIAKNLKIMKEALADLGNYRDDYERAAKNVRATWERAMMATVVNYCIDATKKFNAATSDEERASAMHSLSEAIGFVTGLRCIPSSDRTATDAQLEEILDLMRAPFRGATTSIGEATPYMFFRDPGQLARLDKNTGAVAKLAVIYSFTPTELTDFEQNWVTLQGRK